MGLEMDKLKNDGWFLSEELLEKNGVYEGHFSSVLLSQKKLNDLVQNTDLKLIGTPSIEERLDRQAEVLKGPVVLQVSKIRDVSQPKATESFRGAESVGRMLKVTLTDGHSIVTGVETDAQMKNLSISTPPGTKVKLSGSVPMEHGFLLLSSDNCQVIGGSVEKLIEKWKISQEAAASMGQRSQGKGNAGPPPWVPFGKRIQLTETGANRNFKSLAGSQDKKSEETNESSEFHAARKAQIAELQAEAAGDKSKKFQGSSPQITIPPAGSAKGPSQPSQPNRSAQEGFKPSEGFYRDVSHLAISAESAPAEKESVGSVSGYGGRAPERGRGRGGGGRFGRGRKEEEEEETKPASGPSTLFDFLQVKVPPPSQQGAARETQSRSQRQGLHQNQQPSSFRNEPGLPRKDFNETNFQNQRRGGNSSSRPPSQRDRGGRGGGYGGARGQYQGNQFTPGRVDSRKPQDYRNKYSVTVGALDSGHGNFYAGAAVVVGSSFNYAEGQQRFQVNTRVPPPPSVRPPPVRPPPGNVGEPRWRQGQTCLAPWRDGRMYMAVIMAVAPSGFCTVKYPEYDEVWNVHTRDLIPSAGQNF